MAAGNRKDPKRAASSESRYSLMEFMRDFPDDDACLEWLWQQRFAPAGDDMADCPKCGNYRLFCKYETKQQRQSWTCTGCGHHVHPTAGTIFHKSSTSLHLWFYAMYLMTSTRCGISAKQVERELGVTYKTAWRMFTLIRNELMTDDTAGQLAGTVEMDEMYHGGKPHAADRAQWDTLPHTSQRKQAARKWADEHKTPVFGMVERGGRVSAHVVPKPASAAIPGHISATVEPGSVLHTDEGSYYRRLVNDGWQHHTVNHRERVYVSGDVHTNTIEGFWMLVKTGLAGAHHYASAKWLQGYLNEYAWRYNHREHHDGITGPAQFLLLLVRAATVVR